MLEIKIFVTEWLSKDWLVQLNTSKSIPCSPQVTILASPKFHEEFILCNVRWTSFQLRLLKGYFWGRPHGQVVGFATLLRWPRVSPVQILGTDMAPLIRSCWGGVPHSTTRGTHNYNIQLCTGALGRRRRRRKRWRQMLTQVPIYKKAKKDMCWINVLSLYTIIQLCVRAFLMY